MFEYLNNMHLNLYKTIIGSLKGMLYKEYMLGRRNINILGIWIPLSLMTQFKELMFLYLSKYSAFHISIKMLLKQEFLKFAN